MPQPIKRRSKQAGLPPRTLIHLGERIAETPKITILDHDETHFQEKETVAMGLSSLLAGNGYHTFFNAGLFQKKEVVVAKGETASLDRFLGQIKSVGVIIWNL